jgi:hypothetical protein
MKDCWKILKIQKTYDMETIKKAYRQLIKVYHPDKVHNPEQIRNYTIKCAEINEAYRLASEYAKSYRDAVGPVFPKKTPPATNQSSPSIGETHKTFYTSNRNAIFRFFAAGIRIIIWISLLGLCVLSFLEMSGLYPWLTPFSDRVNSLSLENPVRMVISGFSVAILIWALSLGLVISTFLLLCVLGTIMGWHSKFKHYMFKIGFIILTVLSILAYYANLYWPFKDSSNGYYVFLYHVCHFVSCFFAVFLLLVYWFRDIVKYRTIKESFSIMESDEDGGNNIFF